VHMMRGQLLKDPVTEVTALQLLGAQSHLHVLSLMDLFQNGDYLYSVIPYCRDRDLFGNEMEIVMREMIPVISMMDN